MEQQLTRFRDGTLYAIAAAMHERVKGDSPSQEKLLYAAVMKELERRGKTNRPS